MFEKVKNLLSSSKNQISYEIDLNSLDTYEQKSAYVKKIKNINQMDNKGMTLLTVAISSQPKLIEPIIELGANVNKKNIDNFSPLMLAASLKNLEAVQLLLDKEAKQNKGGLYERTPLIEAVIAGSLDCCEALIKAGADLEAQDQHGCVALSFAVQQNFEMVKLLLKYGANVDAQDYAGISVLMEAVIKGAEKIVACLLDYNPDLSLKDATGDATVFDYSRMSTEKIKYMLVSYQEKSTLEQGQKDLSAEKNNRTKQGKEVKIKIL